MITIKPRFHYDCDVLITGGGPGGSALAYHLARKGHKVIVAEAERFPRDKVCGDGVSPIAISELHAMGITGTEKFRQTNEIKKVGLFIQHDKVIIDLSKPEHLLFHAHIIPRIELDQWIYEAAKNAGAQYLENCRVTDYVVTDQGVNISLTQEKCTFQIKTKVIVGADGSSSTIARKMRGTKPGEEFQLLGLRAYYENVQGPTDRVDIYFSGESFPGIYWLFPKGPDGANIGMAMVSATIPQNTRHISKMLTEHIGNNADIKERIGQGKINGKIAGWPLVFYNSESRITASRVLLVGDAAGLINPLSGDGIQYALLSARWASETLDAAITRNDFSEARLNTYREKVDQELGYDFALSNMLVQFSRNKTLTPVWMSILRIMIARSKDDPAYADTIAGIFEGTYPSHQALNLPFILKTLLQGGKEIAVAPLSELWNNPAGFVKSKSELSDTVMQIFKNIKNDPKDQARWLLNVTRSGISVAGHILGSLGR